MKKKTVIPQKKKRGPPATGKGEPLVVRMQPPMLAELDAWIARQKQPFPSRPEAVRKLLQGPLAAKPARLKAPYNPNVAYEFLQMAAQFFRGYSLIPDVGPIDYARYFLFCHAIELTLKAYLVHLGDDPEDLARTYGHNIKKLMRDCKKRGLPASYDQIGALSILNEPHQKYWARYPKQEWSKGIPLVPQFEDEARALLDAVSTTVYGVAIEGSWWPTKTKGK